MLVSWDDPAGSHWLPLDLFPPSQRPLWRRVERGEPGDFWLPCPYQTRPAGSPNFSPFPESLPFLAYNWKLLSPLQRITRSKWLFLVWWCCVSVCSELTWQVSSIVVLFSPNVELWCLPFVFVYASWSKSASCIIHPQWLPNEKANQRHTPREPCVTCLTGILLRCT